MTTAGRPPKFQSPEDFAALADEYFAEREAEDEPFTVNGLALKLGLCRQSLLNYGEREEFLDTIKAIRARLEDHWEKRLAGSNAAGTIFWLKNQGWSDVQKTELTGRGGGAIETRTEVAVRPQLTREEWLRQYVDPAARPSASGD